MILSRKWLVLALCVGLPLSAQAHRAWLLPSATILSGGEDLWVTVDAAASLVCQAKPFGAADPLFLTGFANPATVRG